MVIAHIARKVTAGTCTSISSEVIAGERTIAILLLVTMYASSKAVIVTIYISNELLVTVQISRKADKEGWLDWRQYNIKSIAGVVIGQMCSKAYSW